MGRQKREACHCLSWASELVDHPSNWLSILLSAADPECPRPVAAVEATFASSDAQAGPSLPPMKRR